MLHDVAFQINPYSIPPFLSSLLILVTGIFVLVKNPSSLLNQRFFYLCLATFVWLFLYSINYTLSLFADPKLIQWLYRLGYCGVCFIGMNMLAYAITLAGIKRLEKLIFIGNLLSALFCYLVINTNYIFAGLYHYSWGYYPKAGTYHPHFLIYALITLPGSLIILIKGLKVHINKITLRNQMKYMIFGLAIFDIACIDFIANYGIPIYPIGYLPATLFILICAYAIVRHRLMDIQVIIQQSIIYSTLLTLITVIYLAFVFVLERSLQRVIGYTGIMPSLISTIFIAFTFVPFRNIIQEWFEKRFFHRTIPQIVEENTQFKKEAVQHEKLKTIATLASSIAHEIRNPLTALKTFVEYFPKKRNDPEFVAKFESLASTEITRIENILNELLEFAKPSPLTLKDTNIKNTLEHALNLTTNQLRKGNIKVVTEFLDNLPTIKADSNKLLQVFINLILNALEAMPNGGKLIITAIAKNAVMKSHRDSLRSQSIQIAASPQEAPRNGTVVITFTDTGLGISKENLNKIFEPFYSTKDTGTGLGLAIVKGIIEDHDGKITVASIKEKGTTFSITLPSTTVTNQ
ncbi:MAG: hypothetical protein H6754_02000 [Candidatus Omnitrophica bacterium]|nr:hypothetical protein [Candidatus Omnitrophota bacterium]